MVMGGLRVDVDEEWKEILADGSTLAPSEVLLLAKFGVLERNVIMDKSKKDSLSKALVCIQVAWAPVKIIARLSYHLSLMLLEINAVAHIGCAAILYYSWFFKSEDLNEPFSIKIPHMLAAVMASTGRFYSPDFCKQSVSIGEPLIVLRDLICLKSFAEI
jgi:hypothetical protein